MKLVKSSTRVFGQYGTRTQERGGTSFIIISQTHKTFCDPNRPQSKLWPHLYDIAISQFIFLAFFRC